MRIPRFYQDQPLRAGSTIELDTAAMRHSIGVLRLKPDDSLILFNGDGRDYSGKLTAISKKQASVYIEASHAVDNESPLQSHLALGIAKGERMDYAIQKAVELGINHLTPLQTERCVVQLDDRREQKRRLHWQGIIRSACEQSGRAVLPKLDPVTAYQTFLETPLAGQHMILDPRSEQDLSDCNRPQPLVLMIGPEGGFSEAERKLAYQHDAIGVRLGPRILRTETAVVAGLTAAQTLWGDLDQAPSQGQND
ncbi:16S rRNA (uracil(1498)-N(3))-methyltransferase [Thiohalophilus thiocyanatoxydans]|uniref:Ribosomal RNA small subunit methyltransferase E n=1 Tax=Thiohalophilus thiocyanatoxydans TaxID=381308 RepID=A0A4R8IU52_9GAMM|nr:16S rRNA (uracil(1498)-N(3))-methyltransferase [Thiohalophilus thiocyanatoxydans]TDY04178.1 16S rRNA (uracil1498-N3)-methyltransferase [Thiohalophilus thiocyanatoxydans]